MEIFQQYLNPYYHPVFPKQDYGWCALTHLTKEAEKIQSSALKIFSKSFATLFDATIGFGLIASLAYNFWVLLYNAYGEVKHLYHNEKKEWNPTALKTWAVIGSSLVLFAGLHHLGAFGALKHWIVLRSSSITSCFEKAKSPSQQNISSLGSLVFSKMQGVVKQPLFFVLGGLGTLVLVGYDQYLRRFNRAHQSFLQENSKHSLCCEAVKFAIEELKKKRFHWPFWGSRVENIQIPALIRLYKECLSDWKAELQKTDQTLKSWATDGHFTKVANRAMKVSLALNCLLLRDVFSLAKKEKKDPVVYLDETQFCHFSYLKAEESFLKIYLDTRNCAARGLVKEDLKQDAIDNAFKSSPQNSWEKMYQEYSNFIRDSNEALSKNADEHPFELNEWTTMLMALPSVSSLP